MSSGSTLSRSACTTSSRPPAARSCGGPRRCRSVALGRSSKRSCRARRRGASACASTQRGRRRGSGLATTPSSATPFDGSRPRTAGSRRYGSRRPPARRSRRRRSPALRATRPCSRRRSGPSPGGGRPPRADDGVEGRLVADALVRGQHGAESGPPATRLGVGYSALGGIGGARSGLALEADFGLRRGLALSAFASLPLEPFPLSGRPEGTRAALWFVGVGLSHPLAPDGARVKPRVGAGFGFGWLSVQSQGTAQPGRLRGPPRSDDLASPAVYAVVGLSLRLIGPVHLSADVYGGATAARFVARDDRGASVGEWGWPLVGGAALGEVQF